MHRGVQDGRTLSPASAAVNASLDGDVTQPTNGPLLSALAASVASILGGRWSVRPHRGGSSGRTFRADGERPIMIRLDASVPVHARLATLGIVPQILGSGSFEGRPFVLQPLVAAPVTSVDWVRSNADDVARLVRRYQADEVLAGLATPLSPSAFARALGQSTRDAALASRVERLVKQAPTVADDAWRATHGDPNYRNFLSSDPPWLVDWDELRRADPMRDIGQIAWWYLDESAWPRFIAACGEQRGAIDRVHWWAAAESLDVAVRLADRDPEAAAGFFGDFEAAIEGRSNPRRG
jgi:hypothetical protein